MKSKKLLIKTHTLMSARETSIEAYEKILKEGLISPRRWEVYATVYNNGPMTSGEAFFIINKTKTSTNLILSQSRARFTELRDMGLLKELGTKNCSITKNKVILWDVTKNLPTKIIIPETKKSKLEKVIKKLENAHLLITDIFEKQQLLEYNQKLISQLKEIL